MKKSKSKSKQTPKEDKSAQYKTIALIILGLFVLYIIYVNFFTIILTLSISAILIIIALIVGGYFILLAIGVEGAVALAALIGLRKKGG